MAGFGFGNVGFVAALRPPALGAVGAPPPGYAFVVPVQGAAPISIDVIDPAYFPSQLIKTGTWTHSTNGTAWVDGSGDFSGTVGTKAEIRAWCTYIKLGVLAGFGIEGRIGFKVQDMSQGGLVIWDKEFVQGGQGDIVDVAVPDFLRTGLPASDYLITIDVRAQGGLIAGWDYIRLGRP